MHDLALAVRRLDPVCAEMCATRPDRMETVVPALREIHSRTEENLGDFAKFVACMKEFHEALVRNCGNQTFELLAGMLEGLWYAHEEECTGPLIVLCRLSRSPALMWPHRGRARRPPVGIALAFDHGPAAPG